MFKNKFIFCLFLIGLFSVLALHHSLAQVKLSPGEKLMKNTTGVSIKKYNISFLKPKKRPTMDPSIARQIAKIKGKNTDKDFLLPDKNLSFKGGKKKDSDYEIKPQRAIFPGAKCTLSQMDEEDVAELNLIYRLDEKSSARLAINEQNIDSTTYAPIKKDNSVNAAGVYLDVDVEEDLELRVGGEVRSHETNSVRAEDKSSQGASLGMKWSF